MELKKQSSIATILINWNGYKDTKECINSLLKVDYENHKIIVVDNASTDDSLELLKKEFSDRVHFIENKKNLGFTGGNNEGFKHALKHNFDYVFVLNNDTIVDKRILKTFIDFFEKNKDKKIGIVSPKIYNYYKPQMIESKGGTLDIVRSRNYPIDYGKIESRKSAGKEAPYEISFATGTAMFIRSSLLKEIGLFDDDYFAYYDDQDFCFRASKKGYSIYYCSDAKIWHKVSASTGGYKNPIAIYLSTRNRIRFILKNGRWHQKALFFPYFLLYYTVTFSIWSVLNREYERLGAFWRALFSYILPIKTIEIQPVNKGFLRIGINARYLQRPITGIERYTIELIKNIENIDKKDRFILFFNKHEKVPQITKSPNFISHISSFPTKSVFWRIVWEELHLYFEIKREKLDVFHGPSFVVPLFKPKKCRYVITIHDLSWFYYPESFTFFNKLFFTLFLPSSIKNSDEIIADSNSTKKDIIKLFNVNPKKIKVVYLGINNDFSKPLDNYGRKRLEKKYKLPHDFILSIGSLLPRKNIVNIIKAFHNLKENGMKEKLVIIGKEAWLYEQIFSAIKELKLEDEVIFTGYVDDKDLPYLYGMSRMLIFPSLYEGFGLPILEAMACGCPVITSNVSSMPEVAGDAALLVNPKSVEEIAKSMEKMIKDDALRNQLISRGYEQIKRFRWEKTAEETLAIYKRTD